MLDNNSYWAATSSLAGDYTAGDLPDTVDCAIVGGGFTGLSAAYHLAKAGLTVAVLEHRYMGWGASGRNGGMVLPGYKAELHSLIGRYGLEKTRRLYDLSLEAIQLVKSLVREERIACDLQETGYFYAAWKPAHYRAMIDWQRHMADHFNHPTRIVPREHLSDELGTDGYYGGLVDESACGLHPGKYVAGLAQAADRAGAGLHEAAGVDRITRRAGGFELVTARGTLKAREVIIATNGYTTGLVPWIQQRIIPIGSYIIATEPLDPALADRLIPGRRMIFDSKHMLYYFRILPDNRMLFGGRASFTPTSVEETGAILRRGMVGLFPELAQTKIAYSWGGMLGFTFDLMPHTGRHEGIHYAVGYGGHGVALTTYLGKKLAESISGGGAVPLAELDFPSIPLYRGSPWFLPFAGLWYEFLDRVS